MKIEKGVQTFTTGRTRKVKPFLHTQTASTSYLPQSSIKKPISVFFIRFNQDTPILSRSYAWPAHTANSIPDGEEYFLDGRVVNRNQLKELQDQAYIFQAISIQPRSFEAIRSRLYRANHALPKEDIKRSLSSLCQSEVILKLGSGPDSVFYTLPDAIESVSGAPWRRKTDIKRYISLAKKNDFYYSL